MKKTLPFFISALLLFALGSFKIYDGPKKAAPGTYQFVVKDTKREYAYTDETLVWIESQRKDHEQITLNLNPITEVIIPSKDEIAAPGFKPMAMFFYVN